jgi:hypothetical protein
MTMNVEQSVEWELAGEIEVLRENLPPLPLCPAQIQQDLTWTRSRAAAVRSRQLTAWAMARPIAGLTPGPICISTVNPKTLFYQYAGSGYDPLAVSCGHGNESSGSHKTPGICWPAEELWASKEGLCSTESHYELPSHLTVSTAYEVVSESSRTVIVVNALMKEKRGGQGHTSESVYHQSETWHRAVNTHCIYTNAFSTSCFVLSVMDGKIEQCLHQVLREDR